MTWLLCLISWAFAGPSSDLSAANQAFLQGDYSRAAETYAFLIEDGHQSGDAYYNLGNALYRDGRKGSAILAWRIAQSLRPRDGDALANLMRVRKELQTGVEPPSSSGPFFLGSSLSLKEQAWTASILLGLVGLLALYGRKRRSMPLGIPALLLGVPGLVLALSVFLSARASPCVVLLDTGQDLRSALGLDGGVVLRQLEPGTEMRLIEEVDDFVLVAIEEGESGWLPASSVGRVDAAAQFPL